MNETQITDFAVSLLKAHGAAAEAEAAEKARLFDEKGDVKQATDWQKIRSAIASIRGPHAS